MKLNLSGCWEIARCERKDVLPGSYPWRIDLPSTTEMAGIKIDTNHQSEYEVKSTLYLHRRYPVKGCVAYRRKFVLSQELAKKNLFLCLERTKYTKVWIDDVMVSESHDTLIPQLHKLPFLKAGEHEIIIVVDNELEAYPDFPMGLYDGHQFTEHTQTNWNGILGEISIQSERTKKPKREPNSGLTVIDGYLYNNHKRVWLRGNLDCGVYPKTGAYPMIKEEWLKIFGVYQEYGFNHCRFHSWCPPEAAFEAADELGIYLQIELSAFALALFLEGEEGYDEVLSNYYKEQSEKVLKEFGHHPSFVIFALGNELTGNPAAYEKILHRLKQIVPEILYTQGSNNFLEDPVCTKEDQIFITMRTKPGKNIRGSFSHHDLPLGKLQTNEPASTDWNYEEEARESIVPLIAHEVGQYQISPNLAEEIKYSGPLRSDTLSVYRERLRKKGMEDKGEEFFYASGNLAVKLFKAEIEGLLRTNGLSGFQLLGLQDFPGQGTALVGVLDSFLESKGLISSSQWREFCSETVILASFPKYVYEVGEQIPVEISLYHYGEKEIKGSICITLYEDHCEKEIENEKDKRYELDEINKISKIIKASHILFSEIVQEQVVCEPGKTTQLRSVTLDVKNIIAPKKLCLEVSFAGIKNHYELFVYPTHTTISKEEIMVSNQMGGAQKRYLIDGGTVLLCKPTDFDCIEGFFPTDFWCYPMFADLCKKDGLPTAPGTMGLLIEAKHPIWDEFPTDYYASWQWQSILKHSNGIILDGTDIEPIVQIIDNFDRCNKIGLLYEQKIGNGRLMVCGCDCISHQEEPAVRQLYYSILNYLKKTSKKNQ